MMTIDDEGEGGGGLLAKEFFQNFPKSLQIWTKIFNFSRKFLLRLF